MSENEKYGIEEDARVEEVRNFLCGYQLCLDMLKLRRYERRRSQSFSELCDCEDILAGNEAYWRARMFEVKALIDGMKNGREKLILYYRYIRGESVERAADLLDISRRTGYRLHRKGLLIASFLYQKMKKQL